MIIFVIFEFFTFIAHKNDLSHLYFSSRKFFDFAHSFRDKPGILQVGT